MADKNWLDEDSASDIFSLRPGALQSDQVVRQCRVLVVEDDPTDFEMIVANLVKTNGVEFPHTRAVRLADGLQYLADGGMEVVLLDLDLPDSRGLETLKKLRFREPDVPVIVVADGDDPSLATAVASEGAQDYLVKGELHSALLTRSIRYSISRNKNHAKLARMLQKAQTSETNLRNVIASNVDGMIVVDGKGAIQFLNPAAEHLLGFSVGDLLRTRFGLPVTACESSETEILRSDGQSVPVAMRIVDVKWEGKPVYLAMFRDLTRQKRAEAKLHESETRFKALFENSPDAIFVEDREGNVLDANPAACRLLEMDRPTLIGKNVLELVPPDQRETVASDFPNVVRGQRDNIEGYAWTKAGRTIPVEMTVGHLRYSGTAALLFHARDISKRKQAEDQLRETQERLSGIFNSSRDAICFSTVDGVVVDVNDAFCELTGYSRDEWLAGQKYQEITPEEYLEDETKAVRGVLATGQPVDFEKEYVRKDGSRVPILLTGFVVTGSDGKPMGLAAIVRDITEQKRAEEELKKHREQLEELVEERTLQLSKANEELRREITERKRAEDQLKTSLCEKEVLLKEIHHRVKNNMQVVSSLLNLQSCRIEDERSREILKDTRSRVTSMAMVHEQLYQSPDLARLDFAKHVRGLASYLIRSYGDASGAVVFREEIGDVNLTLDEAIPCGLIINELVSNALRHAFPDGKEGQIRVGLDHEDDRYVLDVSDNGVGFPADLDIHAATTMGLQIVTTLADQLNGTIELKREGGTIVRITFPKTE